jgi:hypothetical protein
MEEGSVGDSRRDDMTDVEERLRQRILQLEEENATLRRANQLHSSNNNTEQQHSERILKKIDDGGTSDENIIDQQRKGGDNATRGQHTIPSHADGHSQSNFTGVLNPDQIRRYSRQLLVRGGFGVDGQARLLNSSVLIVGAGGIGSTGRSKALYRHQQDRKTFCCTKSTNYSIVQIRDTMIQ